ncbi:MAG: pilus assembly protein, partial [Gardnerella vaginalis]
MENHVFLNILDKRTTKNNCINNSKDSGAVTAEFAIILPAVVVLALTLFFVGKSVVNTM